MTYRGAAEPPPGLAHLHRSRSRPLLLTRFRAGPLRQYRLVTSSGGPGNSRLGIRNTHRNSTSSDSQPCQVSHILDVHSSDASPIVRSRRPWEDHGGPGSQRAQRVAGTDRRLIDQHREGSPPGEAATARRAWSAGTGHFRQQRGGQYRGPAHRSSGQTDQGGLAGESRDGRRGGGCQRCGQPARETPSAEPVDLAVRRVGRARRGCGSG
jgi:hypothetical protein